MSKDIQRAFDEMLQPPDPALRAAVRARLQSVGKRREIRMFQRLARLSVAAVAIFVVGVMSYGVLTEIANHNHPQPGGNGVAPSPGSSAPSPSTSTSPTPRPSCAGTYTVSGNTLTVTIVTDGGPILGSFSVTDQGGDQGFTQASSIQRGQTVLQRSTHVSPPVQSVEISLESINHSFDPILCAASPAG